MCGLCSSNLKHQLTVVRKLHIAGTAHMAKPSATLPDFSDVARSLVLARHLLYTSPLVLHLRTRLPDMSGTNVILWLGMCSVRPGLLYTTA